MTWTVGRVGVSAANGGDGSTLTGPVNVTREGRVLTLTGFVYGSTQAASLWQAQQLLGLVEGEEPVVPVTFADAAGLDGYYRVVGVACDYQMVGSSTVEALAPWQVQLEELPNYRQPRIEVVSTHSQRNNGHSISTHDVLAAYPGPTTDVDTLPIFPADATGTRAVAEGSSIVYLMDSDVITTATSGSASYTVAPASYYHGSVKIEHDIGSSTYRHVVGQPDLPSAGPVAQSASLRLGNGLVRMVLTYSNATVSALNVEWWDGSQWDTATKFYFEGVTTHGELTYHSAAVLANRAEYGALRLRCLPSSILSGSPFVDVSLRRGSRTLTFTCYAATAPAGGWRVGFSTATACTTLTGGLRRTSNNGGGNRELLIAESTHTKDLVNGRLTANAVVEETFGIGCEVAGSSATGQNTQANQFNEWFCSYRETQQVVAN